MDGCSNKYIHFWLIVCMARRSLGCTCLAERDHEVVELVERGQVKGHEAGVKVLVDLCVRARAASLPHMAVPAVQAVQAACTSGSSG